MPFSRISPLLFVLALTVTVVAADIEPGTPKDALKSFYQAMEAGDPAAVRSLFQASTEPEKQLADAFTEFLTAARSLGQAAKAKFATAGDTLSKGMPVREEIAALAAAEVSVQGDTATLKLAGQPKPLKLTRSDGHWRLDIASYAGVTPEAMPTQTTVFKEMAGVFDAVARDINADKYPAAQDAQRALQQKLGAILFNTLQKNPPTTAPTTTKPIAK